MTNESDLLEELEKIEALFAGATTPCDKGPAGAAADRIRARLKRTERWENTRSISLSALTRLTRD